MSVTPVDLLVRGARLTGETQPTEFAVHNGRFVDPPPGGSKLAVRTLDVGGRLVTAPFVDAHMHLDTALSLAGSTGRAWTLQNGIDEWISQRRDLDEAVVAQRAATVLRWFVASGVTVVRCHVDVSDPRLTALRALLQVRADFSAVCAIQLVAFPQDGLLTWAGGKQLLEKAVEMGCDVIGGAPHLEYSREDGVAATRWAVEFAHANGLPVDIHCDETDDPGSRFLEELVAATHRHGMGGRVVASHCTAMASYEPAYTSTMTRRCADVGVGITVSPIVNSLLQGAFDSHRIRRGLAPVRRLLDAGVAVGIGHDSVLDAWSPLGTGNLLEVARYAAIIGRMTEGRDWLDLLDILTQTRTVLIDKQHSLAVGNSADFLVHEAADPHDLIRMAPAPRFVFRSGYEVARAAPARLSITGKGDVPLCRPDAMLGPMVDYP